MIKRWLIRVQAKRWLTKMRAENVTYEQQRAFAAWCKKSKQHQDTYFAERDILLNSNSNEAPRLGHSLAFLSLVAFALTIWLVKTPNTSKIAPSLMYFSAEQSPVTLSDGSVIELKKATKIAVAYSQNERIIKLLEGDAWFDVASDANRPFRVEFNNKQVTALGTSFLINTLGVAKVVVTEHKVSVTNTQTKQMQQLAQGEGLILSNKHWLKMHASEINAALAWRDGKLIFNATPLGDAIKQLQPFMDYKISVVNQQHLNLKVTGNVNTQSPEFALSLLLESLNLKQMRNASNDLIIY